MVFRHKPFGLLLVTVFVGLPHWDDGLFVVMARPMSDVFPQGLAVERVYRHGKGAVGPLERFVRMALPPRIRAESFQLPIHFAQLDGRPGACDSETLKFVAMIADNFASRFLRVHWIRTHAFV